MTTGRDNLDPREAMAVDAMPDELRVHGDPDETSMVQSNDGSVIEVENAEGDREHDALPDDD